MKRTPLRRYGARAKRDAAALAEFRLLVHTRALWSYGPYTHLHPKLYKCERCKRITETIHAHHIVSRARGGAHEESNGAALCFTCHREVHDHIGEWKRWLKSRRHHEETDADTPPA